MPPANSSLSGATQRQVNSLEGQTNLGHGQSWARIGTLGLTAATRLQRALVLKRSGKEPAETRGNKRMSQAGTSLGLTRQEAL